MFPVFFSGSLSAPQASSQFHSYQQAQKRIDPANLNHTLLEQTLIHHTNQERKKHGLKSCVYERKLRETARAHSEEMARLNYFAHESPVRKNRLLDDRMRNGGMWKKDKSIFFGENIGVDYFLAMAGVPFFVRRVNGERVLIHSDTEERIEYQTYWEFSKKMVRNWMNSPGHRKNMLKEKFDQIGIGAAKGKYQKFPAIYVTQNFFGSEEPKRVRE
jgi:uncharacterized protein YkwD